jgi:SET domain-containing protein
MGFSMLEIEYEANTSPQSRSSGLLLQAPAVENSRHRVFAVREIPKGRNPFKIIPKYGDFGYVRVTEDELNALPPKFSELIRSLFIPTDGKMHVPNHGTNMIRLNSYLNHSTEPNMRTRNGYDFTALRKIQIGEELTVDYRTYGAEDLIAMG